ncbi:hypothetical protein NJBCHELONAE_48500 [Mycobacteroides chelonae]|uniref:hypothetical protein n=1 Tax=Mycobacteroides chelonae TaxID=1774 RepID=UPI0021DD85D5|nr:hypothetical protein [Mycobacteroides chelonae]GLE59537.1 hypothetical protein NJBCHELONAE_48500 [Mycobacteroides chelonae]
MPERIVWHLDEFRRVRKSVELLHELHNMGRKWVDELNAELAEAQRARGQEIEAGYVYHITNEGDRARLHIIAATARAMAHEAKHQSILRKTTGAVTGARLEREAEAEANSLERQLRSAERKARKIAKERR